MTRLVLVPVALLSLLACNDPFRGDCACTMKYCSQGVVLRLSGNPDTAVYRDFSVGIAYGDTVEAASPYWPSGDDDYAFTSPRVLRQRPARIGIQIAYTQAGAPKSIDLDTTLKWTSFVCNGCSGSSSSCHDQMNWIAALGVDLGLHL